jgi:hypothetical protein
MAEDEASYLRECRQINVCPTCQKPIVTKVGSGRFEDGVFCSQTCYANWHAMSLQKRHLARLKKERPDG